jgi:hypothetical protein
MKIQIASNFLCSLLWQYSWILWIIFKEINDSFLYTYNLGRLSSFWKVFCCNKVVQHFVNLLFCRNLSKRQKLETLFSIFSICPWISKWLKKTKQNRSKSFDLSWVFSFTIHCSTMVFPTNWTGVWWNQVTT